MTKILLLAVCTAAAAWAQTNVSGDWVLEMFQNRDRIMASRVHLQADGTTLTGKAGGSTLAGKVDGRKLDFDWTEPNGDSAKLTGTVEGDTLRGTASTKDGLEYTWNAWKETPPPAQPRTHEFAPTQFQRYVSSANPPALRIHPGDSVKTWSVDAGGYDPSGKRRSLGGNPLTGPFYVEGALPGDTLVVKLTRVRLNRDWAISGTNLMSNAVAPEYLARTKPAKDFSNRWKLDSESRTASLGKPTDALKNFRVPVDPMLGCVAVAPRRLEAIGTGDSGAYGGNMDFNRIREGTTVYLPVFHPGALLLVGDGHAAQGDGELTGDALETSMDIEFTVDIIPGRSRGLPYAEDQDSLMMIGIAGSLDEALRRATTAMARYLEEEHGLNSTEAAVVLGFAMKYDVADLVGTQVSIVARLPKSTLAQLPPPKTRP